MLAEFLESGEFVNVGPGNDHSNVIILTFRPFCTCLCQFIADVCVCVFGLFC